MTNTPTTHPTAAADAPPRRAGSPRRRRFWPAALLSVAAVAAGVPVVTPAPAGAQTGDAFTVAAPSTRTYGALLDATVADLSRYWAATFPAVYGRPLPAGLRFYAGTPENPPPECGASRRRSYDDVAGNAFYCGFGDFIAWDDAGLFPRLAQRRGAAALAMVLAHEAGHAVQARAGLRLPSVYQEIQADCFAGAWFAHVTAGSTSLRLEDGDLDDAVAALLGLRDRVGIDPRRSGAHGAGFDRVNALQLGYESGARRCADFATRPPRLAAIGFATAADARTGGDVDLVTALELSRTSLNRFWGRATGAATTFARVELTSTGTLADQTAACGGRVLDAVPAGVCPGRGTVLVDEQTATQSLRQVGDLGVGAILAAAYESSHPNVATRFPSPTLRAACTTGAWLAGAAQDGLTLSPGDVDEAIIWTLVRDDSPSATAGTGPFERIRAFRTGFTGADPTTACRAPA